MMLRKVLVGFFLLMGFSVTASEQRVVNLAESCSVSASAVSCEFWFNAQDKLTPANLTVGAQSFTSAFSPYSNTTLDSVTEFWLLDIPAFSSLGARNQFKAELIRAINKNASAKRLQLFYNAQNGIQLLVPATRLSNESLVKEKVTDLTPSPVRVNVDSVKTSLEVLSQDSSQRKIIYWVKNFGTVNQSEKARLKQLFEQFPSIRVVLVPVYASGLDVSLGESFLTVLPQDRGLLMTGSSPESWATLQNASNYSYNGGTNSTAYTDVCGTQNVTYSLANTAGQASTVDGSLVFPDCPELPTDPCEIDAQGDACKALKMQQCEENSAGPGCAEILFSGCQASDSPFCQSYLEQRCLENTSLSGCDSVVSRICAASPEIAICEGVRLANCQQNPDVVGCTTVLYEFCKVNDETQFTYCGEVRDKFCSDNPANAECRDFRFESCVADTTAENCAADVLSYCSDVGNAQCTTLEVDICQADSSLQGCATILTESCMVNPTAPMCGEILTQVCKPEATDARCEQSFNSFCEANPESPHCDNNRTKIIIFLVLVALLFILALFLLLRKRKVYKGNAYLINTKTNKRHGIYAKVTTIGRGRSNKIVTEQDDDAISLNHAIINYIEGECFEIVDCGSTNGLRVNNQVVSAAKLFGGEQIVLGNTAYVFKFSR